ncbi:LuxR C-terminal-related transcriptional regulator [Microbacterium sp. NPDC096154]|uniref:LuxR C-terminal-related transcriptional regulator n=1 Tax=Microbacterium sp. NPDC096154 TaxID=3155549 RepID=UPI0033272E2D
MSPDPLVAQAYLALADAQWQRAVALAEDNWDALLDSRATVLRVIAEAVPAELIAGRARWQQLQAHTPYRPAPPPGRAARPPAHPAWQRIADLTALSRTARISGDIARALECAFEARDIFRRTRTAVEAPASAPRLMFEWALAFVVGGPVARAGWETHPESQLEETFSWAVACDDREIASRCAAELAWLHAFAGRADSTAQWMERASFMSAAAGQRETTTPARLARSMRRSDALDFEGALETVATLSGDHLYDHRILVAGAATMYAVHLGGTAIARSREELARVCEASPEGARSAPLNSGALAYAESYRLLLEQRPSQALRLLASAPGGRLPLYAEARRGTALLQRGDLRGAELAAMAAIEEGGAMPRFAVEAWATIAAVRLRSGSPDAAGQAFGRAVDLADRNGLPVALGLISTADHEALLTLLEGRAHSPSLAALRTHAMRRPEPVAAPAPLTAQELRVVEAMGAHRSVQDVAVRLDVSANTVKTQLRSIYRKLGVSRRSDMLRVAREHGLL